MNKFNKNPILFKILLVSVMTACLFMNCLPGAAGAEEKPPLPDPPEVTGAQIDESAVSEVYYVDGDNNNSSDSNPGTKEQPFKTIGKAVSLALENSQSGKGTKIIINPGVYREPVALVGSGSDIGAPIILEGLNKDKVIIKGSTILEGSWEKSDDCYTHPWPYNWGASADIYVDYGLRLKEIIRRREMLFVNGIFLEQVLSKRDLKAGRFYVDEAEGTVYLMPPAGVDMEDCTVEVPAVDTLVEIKAISNVLLRNLTITHGNPFHPGASISIYKTANIMLENCDVSWSNYFGLGFHSAENITFRGLTLNNNGGGGIVGSSLRNVIIMDSETSDNNWRGMRGDFYDWDTGGIKLLFARGVMVKNHTSNNNYAPGIWFDSDCRDIIIKDSITMGNRSPGKSIVAGIYLEGGIGPYFVDNCVVVGNRRGFNISSANDVYITNSIIADNETAQIYIFGNWGQGRTFNDTTSFAINNRIENTVISAPLMNTEPLITFDYNDPGGYVRWFRTLTTRKLKYYHPFPQMAFLLDDAKTKGDLAQWQSVTGLDEDAEWLTEKYTYVEKEAEKEPEKEPEEEPEKEPEKEPEASEPENDNQQENINETNAAQNDNAIEADKVNNKDAKDVAKTNRKGVYILLSGVLAAVLILWLGTRRLK